MPIKQVKADNITSTLKHLLRCREATKMELVTTTGLSNSTLSDCINNLCKHDIVIPTGLDESIGGRRPTTYAINSNYAAFIGIAINGDNVGVSVIDLTGNVLNFTLTEIDHFKPFITLLYDLIERTLSQFKSSNILGIGIGFTGKIDYGKGIVLSCHNLNWHNVHIKELIERKFFVPTHIDHLSNCAALFESLIGSWRDSDNFAFICDDCREKMGIFLNGEILRGSENLAGTLLSQDFNIETITLMKKFLSLNEIIYAHSDTSVPFESESLFHHIKIDNSYLSRVSAIIAIVNWFESVYFIL